MVIYKYECYFIYLFLVNNGMEQIYYKVHVFRFFKVMVASEIKIGKSVQNVRNDTLELLGCTQLKFNFAKSPFLCIQR